MKTRTILAIAILIATCILVAGCTQPAAPPQAPVTPAPVQTEGVVTLAPQSCSLAPGPTQQLPDYESVSITVDRNTISQNPTITTSFNGGKGLGMVQKMTVTVIRSDCIQEQQFRPNPGIGTSITLMGTTRTDRVIVSLLMTSGDVYTVIDQDYPFQGPMP